MRKTRRTSGTAKLRHGSESRECSRGRGGNVNAQTLSSCQIMFGPIARYSQRAAEGIEESVEVQGRRHNFARLLASTGRSMESLSLSLSLPFDSESRTVGQSDTGRERSARLQLDD